MRDGWRRTAIGEIARVVGGSTPSTRNPDFWGGSIPWITPSEVTAQEGRRIGLTTRAISSAGLASIGGGLLPAGTVLLTSRATVGAVALAGVPMAVNQGFAAMVAGPDVLAEWLMLWCQLNRPHFEALAGGSTFPEVSKPKVRAVELDLPPLADQWRIVDLVSAIDMTVRAANDEAAMARAAYRTLARDLIEDRRWTRRPLGEAVDVRMGRQRSPQHATGDYMVPYLRAANVNDGSMKLRDVLRMNFTPVEQQTFGLTAGDVLVTEGCGSLSQLGASARWSGDIVGVVGFQNTLIRLRSKNGVTSAGFVHHLARHAQAAGWWARIASGTNIFHIGSRRAEILAVPVPPVKAQESLAAMLDAANHLVQSASAYSERLTSVRSAVLLDLLSGDHEIPGSYDRLLDAAA